MGLVTEDYLLFAFDIRVFPKGCHYQTSPGLSVSDSIFGIQYTKYAFSLSPFGYEV